MLIEHLTYPRTGSLGDLKKGCHVPLHSWDIFSTHLLELFKKSEASVDLSALKQYQDRFEWSIDLKQTLDTPYDALVLTDQEIAIQWVNQGFVQMTGYAKTEVLGRSPKMLQGTNTSKSSRDRVRQQLYGQQAFSEDLVNYRKNGDEYVCRVQIHPIYNTSNNLCHYLALENELK